VTKMFLITNLDCTNHGLYFDGLKSLGYGNLSTAISNIFLPGFKHFLAPLWSPILRETLLTNMTNDVAGNDAAYCSIRKKVEQFLIFATKPCQEINFHQIYQNLSKSYPKF
jgi:hypothetical protein